MTTTSLRLKRVRRDRSAVLVCDACGKRIMDKRHLHLLRSKNTLPEDSTVFKVHRACIPDLTSENPKDWETYPLDSAEAKWLFPLLE